MMEEFQLIVQFPILAGMIILWMWNRSLQARLDRMQQRQDGLLDNLLKRTDLQD